MPSDDHRQEPRRLPDYGVGRDQSAADAVAQNFLDRPRHRKARFADGDDNDTVESRQINRLIADLDAVVNRTNARVTDSTSIAASARWKISSAMFRMFGGELICLRLISTASGSERNPDAQSLMESRSLPLAVLIKIAL